MSTSDATGRKSLERILRGTPFHVKRLKVVTREGADLGAISNDFELPDEDRLRLRQCLSWRHEPGVSFITGDSRPTKRRSLGFVSLDGTVVVFEKEEKCTKRQANRSYVIDGPYLWRVKRVSGGVLDLGITGTRGDGLAHLLQRPARELVQTPGVTGWIDEVFDDLVKVRYYDENRQFVFAEIPREKFSRLSVLREDASFRFQIWQGGDFLDYDILPIAPDSKDPPGPTVFESLRTSLAGGRVEEPGAPAEPTDWSNREDRDRYLKELEEKFKGADWGRGSRR